MGTGFTCFDNTVAGLHFIAFSNGNMPILFPNAQCQLLKMLAGTILKYQTAPVKSRKTSIYFKMRRVIMSTGELQTC